MADQFFNFNNSSLDPKDRMLLFNMMNEAKQKISWDSRLKQYMVDLDFQHSFEKFTEDFQDFVGGEVTVKYDEGNNEINQKIKVVSELDSNTIRKKSREILLNGQNKQIMGQIKFITNMKKLKTNEELKFITNKKVKKIIISMDSANYAITIQIDDSRSIDIQNLIKILSGNDIEIINKKNKYKNLVKQLSDLLGGKGIHVSGTPFKFSIKDIVEKSDYTKETSNINDLINFFTDSSVSDPILNDTYTVVPHEATYPGIIPNHGTIEIDPFSIDSTSLKT